MKAWKRLGRMGASATLVFLQARVAGAQQPVASSQDATWPTWQAPEECPRPALKGGVEAALKRKLQPSEQPPTTVTLSPGDHGYLMEIAQSDGARRRVPVASCEEAEQVAVVTLTLALQAAPEPFPSTPRPVKNASMAPAEASTTDNGSLAVPAEARGAEPQWWMSAGAASDFASFRSTMLGAFGLVAWRSGHSQWEGGLQWARSGRVGVGDERAALVAFLAEARRCTQHFVFSTTLQAEGCLGLQLGSAWIDNPALDSTRDATWLGFGVAFGMRERLTQELDIYGRLWGVGLPPGGTVELTSQGSEYEIPVATIQLEVGLGFRLTDPAAPGN